MPNSFASTSRSTDYMLDYGGVTTGSRNMTSQSYVIQAGPAPMSISTNAIAENFGIYTVNLIPDEEIEAPDGGEDSGGSGGGGSGGIYVPPTEEDDDVTEDPDIPSIPIDTSIVTDLHTINLITTTRDGVLLTPDQTQQTPTTNYQPQSRYNPPVIDVFANALDLAIPTDNRDLMFKYHLEEQYSGGLLVTTDNDPLIADQMDPEKTYYLNFSDQSGELLEHIKVETDINGNYAISTSERYDEGNYLLDITDALGEVEKSLKVKIVSEMNQSITLTRFGQLKDIPVKYGRRLYLGKILNSESYIKGKTMPKGKVFAYFQNQDNEDVEIAIEYSYTDKDGDFAIQIPGDLEDGHYAVMIVEVYPDGVVAEHLAYDIELVAKKVRPELSSMVVEDYMTRMYFLKKHNR